jgi:hypothetical protein
VFSSESDKIEWLEKIGSCIKRRLRPKATTVSLALAVEGRQQVVSFSLFSLLLLSIDV